MKKRDYFVYFLLITIVLISLVFQAIFNFSDQVNLSENIEIMLEESDPKIDYPMESVDLELLKQIEERIKQIEKESVDWVDLSDSDNEDPNPLNQFSIKALLSLNLLGLLNIALTNIGLYLTLSFLVILTLYLISNNYNKIVSNNWSASQESLYATIHSIVINQINQAKGQVYFPFIFTLFIFILSNNLIGMIPYSFASTSHFVFTFSLSFTIVLGATILGFIIHKLKLFSLFVPSGCPLPLLVLLVLIEFISYLARNVSLGLRLAANILSGHMLLNILSGFTYDIMNSGFFYFFLALLPLAFIIAFSGLELGIAFIQAQVFVVLSCSYIKDGLELH